MNTLTVNLHVLLASFYRPDGRRRAILIDAPTFPSDRYAVESHLRSRGLDPGTDLIVVQPAAGQDAPPRRGHRGRDPRDRRRPRARPAGGRQLRHRAGARHRPPDGCDPRGRRGRALGPRTCRGQRAADPARGRRRCRGLVHVQVPEFRTRRARPGVRPRGPSRDTRPRSPRWLVGQRPGHAVRDVGHVQTGARCGRLAGLDTADPVARADRARRSRSSTRWALPRSAKSRSA